VTDPSQIRTRVPVYPLIPGHRYGYCGYRTRVHRYGLYPAGFSKPLLVTGETHLSFGGDDSGPEDMMYLQFLEDLVHPKEYNRGRGRQI
jgi:hypothetical protein